jgi:hypothetical protein
MFRMRERPHWHAAGAVVVAILLYISLPERFTVGRNWYLPALEAALLPPLLITTDIHRRRGSRWHRLLFTALSDASRFQRATTLALIGVVCAGNAGSLALLSENVLRGRITSGSALVLSAIQIWLTNIIVFGLWYWQLDRGGPAARTMHPHRPPDFLFPQEATPGAAAPGWRPGFIDYLYVAYTNATAFSPTDSLPLTGWAKLLMAAQALISLITAVLVLSRAVNILT